MNNMIHYKYAMELQTMETTEETPLLSEEIKNRATIIEQVESDVIGINDTMRDIAFLVSEQQNSLDRIEDNILGTDETTERGVVELQQAKRYQSKSRRKLFCLLIIAVVILMMLVAIIVAGIRHKH